MVCVDGSCQVAEPDLPLSTRRRRVLGCLCVCVDRSCPVAGPRAVVPRVRPTAFHPPPSCAWVRGRVRGSFIPSSGAVCGRPLGQAYCLPPTGVVCLGARARVCVRVCVWPKVRSRPAAWLGRHPLRHRPGMLAVAAILRMPVASRAMRNSVMPHATGPTKSRGNPRLIGTAALGSALPRCQRNHAENVA